MLPFSEQAVYQIMQTICQIIFSFRHILTLQDFFFF